VFARKSSAKPADEKRGDELVSLLDPKRSRNCDIGLTRLKMSNKEIREAILSLDAAVSLLDPEECVCYV